MAVFNAIHLGQTMPTERINNMNVNLSTLSISPGIDPFFQTNNLGNTILQGTRSARNWHCLVVVVLVVVVVKALA
jgi:hypothetical protein